MTPAARAIVLRPRFSQYALALDFKNGIYKSSNGLVRDPALLPGYTYTRSGAKSEVASAGTIYPFAANVPGIVPGDGYWSRASLTNNLVRSQEVNDASWTKSGTTVSADAAVAPDGATTADKLIANAAAGLFYARQTFSVTNGATYTFSAFAKQSDAGWRAELLSNAATSVDAAVFDLSNGTVVASSASVSASITPVGSGWYRISITVTATATASKVFDLRPTAASAVNTSSTGNGAKGVFYWQAQLVVGSRPGPIIATTGAAATVGADALSASLSNGTYSAVYTFDDLSTQTISTVISGGAFAMPVYPTTLNRPLVQLVTLRV